MMQRLKTFAGNQSEQHSCYDVKPFSSAEDDVFSG